MVNTPQEVAEYIINNAPRSVSHLELQRYLYCIALRFTKCTQISAFDEGFIARKAGPIIQSVWDEYFDNGSNNLPKTNNKVELEATIKRVTDHILNAIEKYDYFAFTNFALRKQGPWDNTYYFCLCNEPISKELMELESCRKVTEKDSLEYFVLFAPLPDDETSKMVKDIIQNLDSEENELEYKALKILKSRISFDVLFGDLTLEEIDTLTGYLKKVRDLRTSINEMCHSRDINLPEV